MQSRSMLSHESNTPPVAAVHVAPPVEGDRGPRPRTEVDQSDVDPVPDWLSYLITPSGIALHL
jgi:hypothetical protein